MDPRDFAVGCIVLDHGLLNRILIEEGMDSAEAEQIKIFFPHSRERTRAHKLWNFLLFGGSAAGSWIEEQRIALIYCDKHRSTESLSRTLAHELGHAFDHSKVPYGHKVKWLWRIYLGLLAIGTPLLIRWHGTFGGDLPLLVMIGGGLITWFVLALALASTNWALINHWIYSPDPGEKAAREWTQRLTSREDWKDVLQVEGDVLGREEK
ncbi:hypothetical protein A3J33_00650 [candidate division WWE3 bacterium RIFCSPLOWO2_02_FULL_53_10]|uniref:Uncharacterized protein n=2 Tax=Katanobacteria TaxID=422282 RepID=A0A1F4WND6_UNCKA|nr:MAG: hypothetical protein A2890_00100 [candidate division WWE3 bacterium RIFCSPLOWO2_01_FULL_53_14]OGC70952.1 MAG: hypothetical protein A3J33_00650 [candidate division WWE3 bacterium RIFCSPLOWO2_02_FULL_53_10]